MTYGGNMMRFNSKSINYTILTQLMSRLRQLNLPSETNYIILYTFFYKYCSDNLKDHMLMVLNDEELTFDEAYNQYVELRKKDKNIKLNKRNIYELNQNNVIKALIKLGDYIYKYNKNNVELNSFNAEMNLK